MTDLDIRINNDLQALADETRQGELRPIAGLVEPRSAYRDDRPGAEARRAALANRRHLELALMPLALQQIFVHRVSRAVVGLVAGVSGLAIFVGLWEPGLIQLADFVIPGRLTVPLLLAIVAVLLAKSYVIAGWVAERVFERRMRESLETSGEVYEDLDALASGPLDEARSLVRRTDGWSISLPLIGASILAPIFGLLSIAELEGFHFGYQSYGLAAYASHLGGNLALVIAGIAVGFAIALVVGRGCDRAHRALEQPTMLRVFGHPGTLIFSICLGLLILAMLANAINGLRVGLIPPIEVRLGLAVAGTVAITAPVTWLMLWNRRREQRRLELDRMA